MNCPMPIHVDRFIQETQDLSYKELGGYISLLCKYWKSGGVPILLTMTESLTLLFKETADGYIHLEMDAELKVARLRHDSSVRNGKLGGRPVAEALPPVQPIFSQYPSSDSTLPPGALGGQNGR